MLQASAWRSLDLDELSEALVHVCAVFATGFLREGEMDTVRAAIAPMALKLARAGRASGEYSLRLGGGAASRSDCECVADVVAIAAEGRLQELRAAGGFGWDHWPKRRLFEAKAFDWASLPGCGARKAGFVVARELAGGEAMAWEVAKLASFAKADPRGLDQKAALEGIEAGAMAAMDRLARGGAPAAAATKEAICLAAERVGGSGEGAALRGRMDAKEAEVIRVAKFVEPWAQACAAVMEGDSASVLAPMLRDIRGHCPEALGPFRAIDGWMVDAEGAFRRSGLVEKAVGLGAFGCVAALVAAGVPTLAEIDSAPKEGNVLARAAEEALASGAGVAIEAVGALARAVAREAMAAGKEPSEAAAWAEGAAFAGVVKPRSGKARGAWDKLALSLSLALAEEAGEAGAKARRSGPGARL
jgi:hypothetical protein